MRDAVVDLTSRLVAIDSVNPSLVPGGAGEAEIAAFVAAWAREAGLEAEVLEGTPGRPSVLVRARGRGGGRTLLLCGHLDTVTVEGMDAPHAPRVVGDRLHGRGAYDMKAGLAAALLACRSAAGEGLAGDVVVAAVADEEHASLGVQEVLGAVRADAAIVTEPTELDVVVAHKGFVWAELEVEGRAAHGSRPHLGVDAIVKAGPLLTGLGALDERLAAVEHPLLGRGSVHASVIAGGAELSSYPARCVIGLERRTLPGETAAGVEAELDALIAESGAPATRRTLLVREPFEADPDSAVVQALLAERNATGLTPGVARNATGLTPGVARNATGLTPGVARNGRGLTPGVAGASYWADAAFLAAAGIPTAMFGPSGEGAHAQVEWVSIDATVTVTETIAGVARRLCA